MDDDVASKFSVFADETRVMGPVQSEEDVENLQKDLDKIYNWQNQNNILFNINKFKKLRYGENADLKKDTRYLTPGCEDLIEVMDSLKDLGIIMSDNATFKNHVDKVCNTVKQKCASIVKTCSCRETTFMKFIGKA